MSLGKCESRFYIREEGPHSVSGRKEGVVLNYCLVMEKVQRIQC
jgi:hypothetical protein